MTQRSASTLVPKEENRQKHSEYRPSLQNLLAQHPIASPQPAISLGDPAHCSPSLFFHIAFSFAALFFSVPSAFPLQQHLGCVSYTSAKSSTGLKPPRAAELPRLQGTPAYASRDTSPAQELHADSLKEANLSLLPLGRSVQAPTSLFLVSQLLHCS